MTENALLLNAIRSGKTEDVRRFLVEGKDVNAADRLGMTPLHWSVYHGKITIAKLLIKFGADVHAEDASDETPLHYAAARSTPDLAELLILFGADVNAADAIGQTPLHYAAIWNGGVRTSALLIAESAMVDVADKEGNTPLALAEDRLFDALSKLLPLILQSAKQAPVLAGELGRFSGILRRQFGQPRRLPG